MDKKQKQKQKKWIKPRHKIIKSIVYPFLSLHVKKKYGITVEPFNDQEKRPYLILMNHQTGYDQFFIDMVFKGPVYAVASEDIFSTGLLGKLLRHFVAPIPIKKGTRETSAVMTCMRIAKEGGSIAIFPEGNRTYSGKTEYINPSISKLAKALKLPIAFMRIEGGYGVQPRWSNVVRKGAMRAYVSRIIEPEEIKNYQVEELYDIIVKELMVNENVSDSEFTHKKLAEYLERAVYVCPYCGISNFVSKNDVICCKKCNKKIQYLNNKQLRGVGFDFPFKFVGEWYDYQTDFISKLDISNYSTLPAYTDKEISLFNVILYKNKSLLKRNMTMSVYNDRFEFIKGKFTITLPLELVTAVTVLGKNKLNVYIDNNKKAYQIKGNKRFNALKYVHFYYHYKNIKSGVKDGKFLGL